MKTEELIRALALDVGRPVRSVPSLVTTALLGGGAVSLLLFLVTLEVRPDFATALYSAAFCLKITVVVSLAVTAAMLLGPVARPTRLRRSLGVLAVAPILLSGGVAFELFALPDDSWHERLIGRNAPHCLALIPLLAAAPAVFLLLAMRHAAPARPGLAGAVIGLSAGGFGALLYALSCPDDSPMFVAVWYSIAIALTTGLCYLAGRRWLRW